MQKKALGQGAEILGEICGLDKLTSGAKPKLRLSVGLVSRSERVLGAKTRSAETGSQITANKIA